MTDRRPLVTIAGVIREIPTGDMVPSDIVPLTSALVDGGSPSTSSSGLLRVDFGAVT